MGFNSGFIGLNHSLQNLTGPSPLQTLSTLVTGLVQGVVIKNLRGILTKSDKVYIQFVIVTVGSPPPGSPTTKIKEQLSGKIQMLMEKMELAQIFTLISFGIVSY